MLNIRLVDKDGIENETKRRKTHVDISSDSVAYFCFSGFSETDIVKGLCISDLRCR